MAVSRYSKFEYWGELIVNACSGLLGTSGGCISLLDDGGKEREVVLMGPEGAGCTADSHLPSHARRVKESVYQSGRVAYQNDVASTERGSSRPDGNFAIESILFAPLTVENKIAGVLGVFNRPGGFSEDDGETAAAFGDIASMALQNSRTLESLGRSKETLRSVLLRDAPGSKGAMQALDDAHSGLEARMRDQMERMVSGGERLFREMRERRKTDQALRESEAKYRIIADNTHDWEWWLAPDGRFIHMSPSCKRITGRDPEEFLSEPALIMRVVHADDRATFLEHRNEVDRTLAGGSVEFRVVRPDGTVRWVAHVCQPVFDQAGRFMGHRGSNRDVTERKQAEEALRLSEQALRTLSSQLLTVQESEKRRVARELHDGVNQTLSAIKFALESRLSQMARDGAPSGISLENIISMVQHAIEETRAIQMDLRPSVLDDLGILATLSWFGREFENVYKHIRIERNVDIREEEVPDALKTVIFRIVQEALNNVARHSRADLVRVALKKIDSGIELVIEDNGRGFDVAESSGRFGLVSMRERAELSGGTFRIDSTVGKGTRIRAVWRV